MMPRFPNFKAGARRARPETEAADRASDKAPLATGAAVLSTACFGLGTVMSEAALARVPPLTLLPLQLSASVAFLAAAILWRGVRLPRQRGDLKPALAGILEPGLAYTAGVVGLALTTASNATLVGSTETVVTIFLAWLLLRERVGARMVALALVAVVLLVTVPDSGPVAGGGSFSGDLLVFAGVVFAALYAVATRRHAAGVDPALLAAMQHSVGLVWSMAVLAGAVLFGVVGGLGLAGLGATAFAMALASGVVQYALPFWLYLFALRGMTVGVLSFYLSLIPVFGVAGALHLFLGERLAPSQLLGGLLIVAAVSATSRLRR